MSKNSTPPEPRQQPGPDDAVNEILILYPKAAEARDGLSKVVQQAWRGEWPPQFFEQISSLTRSLPWLEDQLSRWIDPKILPLFLYPEDFNHYLSRKGDWADPAPRISLTPLTSVEGLLLLSKLEFGPIQNESAHRVLRRVLDQIDAGLIDGGPDRPVRRRRHPLKDVFKEIGRPQTIERLAHSLNAILPNVDKLYPRLATFIRVAFLPLACGRPVTWIPPSDFDESDLLDTEKRPSFAGVPSGDLAPHLDGGGESLPAIEKRAFTASDLADEMLAMAKELEPHRDGLVALSKAWRGEETWAFYESVSRLGYWLPWLQPLLEKRIASSVLPALRIATRSSKRQFFSRTTAAKWRERTRLAPRRQKWVNSPFAPKGPDWGVGIDHLRGLLLAGRLEWGPSENEEAQAALAGIIAAIESPVRSTFDTSAQRPGVALRHPLGLVLDGLGKLKQPAALVAALERLLPDLAESDAELAGLLGEAYLPLVGGKREERAAKPPGPIRPPGKRRSAPGKRRRSPRSKVRRLRIHIPTRQAPLPGESIEETSPGRNARQRGESNTKALPLKEEIRWLNQRVYGSNQLVIRNHIESLSDAEALIFARALDERIASAISAKEAAAGWLGILVALTLITGQGIRTWIDVDVCRSERAKTGSTKPQLLLREGILRLPVVRPESAFKPDDLMQDLLEPTVPTVDLHLSPTLQNRVNSLLEIGDVNWSRDEGELRRSLETFVADLEPCVGTGISLARVRLVARGRLREVTNDLGATMILCGDTFGMSTAPLYYCCVRTAHLEQAFRAAAWPLFGDQAIASKHPEDAGTRVGSQLLVTKDAARALARSPSAPMHSAGKKKRASEFLVNDHNNLTNHTLCLLMAAAGHRPTSALLALKRYDFDMALHAAVFADKPCDPAHLYRYAPTADLISRQLEKYVNHVRALSELPGIDQKTAAQAREAVLGEGPLFFHLRQDASPLILTFEAWKTSLPPNWQVLPLNWGRTWLASRGRDAGIDSDHLSITLGHLDAAGYPYATESPLEPARLSRAMSGALGHLAKSAGWVARNGLASTVTERDREQELGPLRDWTIERSELAALSKAHKIEERQVLRSHFRGKREEGEKIARAALESIVPGPIPEFAYFKELRNKKRAAGADVTDPPTGIPVALSPEGLESVQSRIDQAAAHNKVLAIAAHNALHRYLKSASELLCWDCPIPSPWLAPASQEPTPFFPGLFRATSQVRTLRRRFGRIPRKAPPETSFTPLEWACGQSVIALCIFGFVDDQDQALEVLRGRRSGVRSSTIADLLLVEAGEDRRVVGIRGLAAISVSRLARQFPKDELPHADRLNAVVAAQLPPAFAGSPSDALTRLFATISVTNIVELSGLARTSLDRRKGCVAMPAARQRQMLEEGHGLAVPIEKESVRNDDACARASGRKYAPSVAQKQYPQLRDTLHIGDGPKKLPITAEHLSQANIEAFRNPLCRELTAFLAQADLSPLVACIGAFALHMTAHGTQFKRDPGWNTVYSYITSFGSDLVDLAAEVDFLNLDAEEYIDLFQDIIDRKDSSTSKALTGRELVNFHVYLQKHHDFEAVDFSDLEGIDVRPDFQVDAEVIQPQEFALGLEQLSVEASVSRQGEHTPADHLRTHRQAEVFALLLRPSGARHNELSALRFKDVLATADSTILLIRPSRYRRLKTSSARRMVDISARLTRRQRVVVSNWIDAEKARLGASWKPTLPILGKMGAHRDRASSRELRDITLSALEGPVGFRTKIHRARHLVAGEDMLAVWFSDADWRAWLGARVRTRRSIRGFGRAHVVLPRHIREQSLRFGHRRSSTTLANYFHMPWATTSRPHEALAEYVDSHSAAVALGTSSSSTFKIGYRANGKALSPEAKRFDPVAAWLTHIAGMASPTPGVMVDLPSRVSAGHAKRLAGRIAQQLLRDIQRGLEPGRACLVHGLTTGQLERLHGVAAEVEQQTGFRIWPRPGETSKPRSAREFQDAKALDGILDMMDKDPSDPDRQLVLSASRAYMLWARRGERDYFAWPHREARRLAQLLVKLGLLQSQMICTSLAEPKGFEGIQLLRSQDPPRLMNHALAWLLVVVHIVEAVNNP